MSLSESLKGVRATPLQEQKFMEAYEAQGFTNATAAARAAGFLSDAKQRGNRLLMSKRVREWLQAKTKESAERMGITPDSVRRRLIETYESSVASGNFSAAARCIELMGKDVGMFDKNSTVNLNVNGPIEHEATGELARLMGIAKNAGIIEGDYKVIEDHSNG